MDDGILNLILLILLVGGGAIVEMLKRRGRERESEERLEELKGVDEAIRRARGRGGRKKKAAVAPEAAPMRAVRAERAAEIPMAILPGAAAAPFAMPQDQEVAGIAVRAGVPGVPISRPPAGRRKARPSPGQVSMSGALLTPELRELREALAWREALLPPLALRDGESSLGPRWPE